eukprot:jgi/Chlat1/2010/Chrsp158S02322
MVVQVLVEKGPREGAAMEEVQPHPQPQQRKRRLGGGAGGRGEQGEGGGGGGGGAEGGPNINLRHPEWRMPPLHEGLQISPHTPLQACKERMPCPQCKKSRRFFCYDCLIPMTPGGAIPCVQLPCQVHVLISREVRAMSTGVHARLLAPHQVEVWDYDSFPVDNYDPKDTYLLFPSSDSITVAELPQGTCKHIIAMDSKWKKAGSLVSDDPRLGKFPRMRLCGPIRTAFWRPHTRGVTEEGVSTVEAIYFFCKQLHQSTHHDVCHCYDDLLFYFTFYHEEIRKGYMEEKGKFFNRDDARKLSRRDMNIVKYTAGVAYMLQACTAFKSSKEGQHHEAIVQWLSAPIPYLQGSGLPAQLLDDSGQGFGVDAVLAEPDEDGQRLAVEAVSLIGMEIISQ